MKIYLLTFLFSVFFLLGCAEKEVSKVAKNEKLVFLKVPQTITPEAALQRDATTNLWLLNSEPYSGFIVSYYPDSSIMEKIGIVEGKKQNEATQWYNDGHLKNTTNYYQSKLHGEKKVWSADAAHVLIAHYNFYKGKGHGEQKKWYPTGELYQILNFKNGKEEGVQQAYRKNGALYANYEAKEGRIFGLKKTALCFGLEDQKVKNEE